MKNILFITLLLGLFCQNILAQTASNTKTDIENKTASINEQLSTYSKIEQFSDNTGSRESYLENGKLVKVTIAVNQKNIAKYVEWYFNDDQLIYAEQKWLDQANNNQILNNEKIYLVQNQIISWVKTDGQEVNSEAIEFKNNEIEILELAQSFVTEVR